MTLQGIKALFTGLPSVDGILSDFRKTHAKLLAAAAKWDDEGRKLQEEAEELERKATAAFVESERAERIAEKFQAFVI